MRKFFLFFLFIVYNNSFAQTPFITTWKTTTNGEKITISTKPGYLPNCTIDWGDGSPNTTHTTDNPNHIYINAGLYQVTVVSGSLNSIYFNNTGDKDKIISIDQWGTGEWYFLQNAFSGCINLEGKASDEPNIKAKSLLEMFAGATKFNQDISKWDVSSITVMTGMFNGATAFNNGYEPLNWGAKTALLQNTRYMFSNSGFDKEGLETWNISSLTDAERMFSEFLTKEVYDKILIAWQAQPHKKSVKFSAGTSKFCIPEAKEARSKLINEDGWEIEDRNQNESCVVNNTTDFITIWKTISVDEIVVIPTFPGETYNYTVDWGDGVIDNNQTGNATHTYRAPRPYRVKISGKFPRIYFNNTGDKDKIVEIEQWGSQKWTSMDSAFKGCTQLAGQASDKPDLSKADNLSYMFSGATIFNQNIGNWEVGTIKDMSYMFHDTKVFDQDIGNWNTSRVMTMEGMFSEALEFNQDISFKTGGVWNTSEVTNMTLMFAGAKMFNKNIGNWKTRKVKFMTSLFRNAIRFNQNLKDWDVGNLTSAGAMFDGVKLLTVNYDALLIGWNKQNLKPGVTFSGGDSQFCDGKLARANMKSADNWKISDGEEEAGCASATLDCPIVSYPTKSPILTDVSKNPTIKWKAVMGAAGYKISIGENAGGTTVLNKQDVVGGNTLEYQLISSLKEGSTYYLTVYAYNASGEESTGCTEIEFKIKLSLPDCIKLAYPADKAKDIPINATLTWLPSQISNATGYAISVKTQSGTIIENETKLGAVNVYKPQKSWQENTTYLVTVTPYNDAGKATGCTETSFTTASVTAVPSCTELKSPSNGETNVPVNVGLRWDVNPTATGYRITIGKTSGLTDVLDNHDIKDGTIISYTHNQNWDKNQEYYVTIIAYNAQGDATGCTETSFTTGSTVSVPDCTVLKSPSNGEANVPVNVGLRWDVNPTATGYRITIGKTSGLTDVLDNHDIKDGTITSYTHNQNWDKNQEYYVTIIAYNAQGDATGCTEMSFTTASGATAIISDIPPFFTPNNDGVNDYWQVTDVGNKIKHIRVFDRFGKLLKQFTTSRQGWDGNYMGSLMPNSDYWYLITYNSGKRSKGHFSLIRR